MSHAIIPIFLYLIISTMCMVILKTYGFSMELIPITSPHLQILPNHLTIQEQHQFLANISMSRVLHYLRKDFAPESMRSTVYNIGTTFVTRIGIGEGAAFESLYLIMDTGSDLTWVQCEGCDDCFPLTNGRNFQYTQSPSFQRVSIYDHLCLPGSEPHDGSCGFEVHYSANAPHPMAKGLLGREDFQLLSMHSGASDVYPNLVFGCTLNSKNFNFKTPNSIAGVFGLSSGPRSFISQLDAQTKGRFSYCLAPFTKPSVAVSSLYFGDDAQISGDATTQVQTISIHPGILNHLYLNGISVDGKRLGIELSLFELQGIDKGFFIDSGTPYTMLTEKAYGPLRKAIGRYFRDRHGWQPRRPTGLLDLCYSEYPGYASMSFPSVIFHFRNNRHGGEVDMVMHKNNMFQPIEEQGFCMMVVPLKHPGLSYFGAFQHINFKMLYDIPNALLSFVPQYCMENVP